MELIRKETEAIESREPGTEENPLESLQKQTHQDDPQQAAVAELPRFVDLVLQTDDEGKKKRRRTTKRFYIFSSAGNFLALDGKGLASSSARDSGSQSVVIRLRFLKVPPFDGGHLSSLLFSSFSTCLTTWVPTSPFSHPTKQSS